MSGVANKEEALRCLQIAEKALQDRDFEKANRFCQKARKLCLCDEVRLFQRKLSNAVSGGQNASTSAGSSSTATTTATEGVRQRHGPNLTQDTAASRPKATKEQEVLVSQILKSKDFYDILSVSKDANEDEIKKSYKKLALKLHPDKNKAARAEDAFKAVSRAFSCLSDPEKRRTYDQYGHEDPGQASAARRAQHFYADEIDPQELFNMFFGGGFPMQGGHVYRTHFRNVHRRPQNHQNDNQNTQPSWGAMLHFLPMVFLFLFTFWGGQQESPPYSLRRETMYNQELFTKARNVPFYVHDKRVFAKQYPEQSYGRTSLEREVETRVMRYLQSQCDEEVLRKRRVEFWKGPDAANRIELTSCKRYRQLFEAATPRTRVN